MLAGFMDGDIDERRANAFPPMFRLNEKSVEFHQVFIHQQGDKADRPIAHFGNNDLPHFNLPPRKLDCLRLGLQLRAIFVERERCSALQLLQLVALFRRRQADMKLSGS